jgi:hypothetical protein
MGPALGDILDEVGGTWGTATNVSLPADAALPPVVPAGLSPYSLSSVSCVSPGNCSAAGEYLDGSYNSRGLLLNEVSGTWATGIKAALPPGAAANPAVDLSSVSCASAGNCSAVGEYRDSSGNTEGLLLNEVSGTWATGIKAALPPDAAANPMVELNSLSCASAGNCAAVGDYDESSSIVHGLLLDEVGGTWGTARNASLPTNVNVSSGVPSNSLSSVSCASSGNCTAVGGYTDSSGNTEGFLLDEAAGTWESGVEAPLPPGAAVNQNNSSLSYLNSVSCGPAGECSAVGSYYVAGGIRNGLVETLTSVVSRVYGQDAIDTSIAISQAEFPTTGSAGAVVLARSDYFSDALAGGPLAAKLNAPLLITPGASSSQSLDPRVLAEVERVLPEGKTVYILGGDLALSPAIDTTLEGVGYNVVREAGADEYATAVNIAQLLGNPSTIFEVTGLDFDDAASAVPAAVADKGAILLTDGPTQAPETAAYLSAHPYDTRFAIGGPLAAAGADPSATGVYGGDLYGTSVAVATRFFSQPATFGAATSATFTDALSAGPVLGLQDAPLLLVPPSDALPSSVDQYLSSVAGGLFGGTLYGGPLAVGEDVLSELNSEI